MPDISKAPPRTEAGEIADIVERGAGRTPLENAGTDVLTYALPEGVRLEHVDREEWRARPSVKRGSVRVHTASALVS